MTTTFSSAPPRQALSRHLLANGLRILAAHNPAVDIAVVRLFLPCGSHRDPVGKGGLAHLMSEVLSKGTQRSSSEQIAAQVESLGAAIGTDVTADYFEISLKCIAADLEAMLRLMAEILLEPIFPESEVSRERDLTLQAIQSQQERPFSLAFDQLRQALFPAHAYAFSPLGQQDSVQALQREDLVAFHASHVDPRQAVVAVIGPQSLTDLQAQIEAVFSDWIPSPGLSLDTSEDSVSSLSITAGQESQILKTAQDNQQSMVMLGSRGSAVGSADYAPLKLLATYLGNGLSSRLFVELREKRGLAYEVSAFFATRRDPAPFVAYMGTAWSNTVVALEGLQAELYRLTQDPLSADDLARTQRKVLGQYALGKQTNAQIAQVLGWYEILGLGAEFDQIYPSLVQAVTIEQLFEVAQRYLSSPVISLVGPAQALAEVPDSPV
ncbi:MAG: insulinase family protein [Synechococcaceae cyanobacterium SM2_3_2]|nr:insulinase family protein [Synechococcaceae cyanobacterium SM2_3_2]